MRTPHTPTGSKVAHKHAHTCRTQTPQVTRTKKRKYNKMCLNTMEYNKNLFYLELEQECALLLFYLCAQPHATRLPNSPLSILHLYNNFYTSLNPCLCFIIFLKRRYPLVLPVPISSTILRRLPNQSNNTTNHLWSIPTWLQTVVEILFW